MTRCDCCGLGIPAHGQASGICWNCGHLEGTEATKQSWATAQDNANWMTAVCMAGSPKDFEFAAKDRKRKMEAVYGPAPPVIEIPWVAPQPKPEPLPAHPLLPGFS